MVATSTTAAASAATSVKVIICAQMSARLPGENCGPDSGGVGEPADVRADVEHERDPQQQPAEQVHAVAEGVEPREGGRARADHQRDEIDRMPSITGTANRNIIVVPCIVKSSL